MRADQGYPCPNPDCTYLWHPGPGCPYQVEPIVPASAHTIAQLRQLQREGRLAEFEIRDSSWPWVFLLGLIALVALGLMLLI